VTIQSCANAFCGACLPLQCIQLQFMSWWWQFFFFFLMFRFQQSSGNFKDYFTD